MKNTINNLTTFINLNWFLDSLTVFLIIIIAFIKDIIRYKFLKNFFFIYYNI